MKISKNVLEILAKEITLLPPETGGILGSCENSIITDIVLDKPRLFSERACCYSPNVIFLNEQISLWLTSGKQFIGIFHTHFGSAKTLSHADREYIEKIMLNMPNAIECLYFPIYVLPDREIVSYKARKEGERIRIKKENVQIVY